MLSLCVVRTEIIPPVVDLSCEVRNTVENAGDKILNVYLESRPKGRK